MEMHTGQDVGRKEPEINKTTSEFLLLSLWKRNIVGMETAMENDGPAESLSQSQTKELKVAPQNSQETLQPVNTIYLYIKLIFYLQITVP